METFVVRDLTFSYPESPDPALSGISFAVRQGEFVTICGLSGSGKSTLIRHLKPMLAPTGNRSGEIFYDDKPLEELDLREQSSKIGFVMQSPDNQIVTDKVWHELAFGLESLGMDSASIRLRVAEMASFFGIQTWFHRDIDELSGGQKQLLNLASVMAMQPSVLILDEPTSYLDPIAATEFLETVSRINESLGTTVIITEQRLEEVLPMSDRVIVLDSGRIVCDSTPKSVGLYLKQSTHPMFLAMPTPMRIHAEVDSDGDVATDIDPDSDGDVGNNINRDVVSGTECPLTVREGRQWLDNYIKKNRFIITPESETSPGSVVTSKYASTPEEITESNSSQLGYNRAGNSVTPNTQKNIDNTFTEPARRPNNNPSGNPKDKYAIVVKDIWYRYDKKEPDVIKGLSLKLHKQKFNCIVGGNGTGKTTALNLIAGLYKPYRGKINTYGKIGMLPQNPQSLFIGRTVEQDLSDMLISNELPAHEQEVLIQSIVEETQIETLLPSHPYDLSGGEQQRVALAKVLLLEPDILLLDEPTKGMDFYFKERLASLLRRRIESGKTVVMVSHDIEFCACYSDYCVLFFDGDAVSQNTPRKFFAGNSFYTTVANRMARHISEDIVTAEDVIELCQKTR